jgi:hypothetical protein
MVITDQFSEYAVHLEKHYQRQWQERLLVL